MLKRITNPSSPRQFDAEEGRCPVKTRMRAVLLSTLLVSIACTPAAPAPAPATSGSSANPPPESRATNQVLRIAKIGLPGSASPESSGTNNDIFLSNFDALLTVGAGFEVKPAVAERWEFRPADNAWRFSLRRDLTFSNGDKLTAEDVAYSVNLIVEKNLPTKATLPLLTGATKVDDYTVDLVSRSADTSIPNGAPWIWIFPAKYHRETGPQFGAKPVGSGPYELAEFAANDRMVYKLRSAPHPYRRPVATELRFLAVPELSQHIAGLRTGDLDIAQGNYTGEQAGQLKNAGLGIIPKVTGVVSALFSQPEMEARNTPLKDKRVRQALNYALNKNAIVTSFYQGFAEPAGQVGVPESPFWNPASQPFPYDVNKAKQLLSEAGYPNGFKLPQGIEYTPRTAHPDLVLALQSALKDVGVEAEVKSFEFAVFLDKFYARNGQQKGDLFVQSQGDPNGMFSQARGLFGCDKPGFEVWWCNRDFVRLYDQSLAEPDPAKRAALTRQANAALFGDVPAIYIVAPAQFMVHNQKVRGVEWTTSQVFSFDKVYRIE